MRYDAAGQASLPVHQDENVISSTIALNAPSEYEVILTPNPNPNPNPNPSPNPSPNPNPNPNPSPNPSPKPNPNPDPKPSPSPSQVKPRAREASPLTHAAELEAPLLVLP